MVLAVLMKTVGACQDDRTTVITGQSGIDDGIASPHTPDTASPRPDAPPAAIDGGQAGANGDLQTRLDVYDAVIEASEVPPEVAAAWSGLYADTSAHFDVAGDGGGVVGMDVDDLAEPIERFQEILEETNVERGVVEQWDILRAELEQAIANEP